MPDTEEIREPLLDMLGAIEIDEHVELAVDAWGEPARDLLRKVVRGEIETDGYRRCSALYLLGRSAHPEDPDEIAGVLDQEVPPPLRLASIDALRAAGGATARKALLRTVMDPAGDISERLHAIEGLRDIGELDDVAPLEELETKPEELALAQRIKHAAAEIRYRAGAPAFNQEDVDDPD